LGQLLGNLECSDAFSDTGLQTRSMDGGIVAGRDIWKLTVSGCAGLGFNSG
jgi:hypothetical protein